MVCDDSINGGGASRPAKGTSAGSDRANDGCTGDESLRSDCGTGFLSGFGIKDEDVATGNGDVREMVLDLSSAGFDNWFNTAPGETSSTSIVDERAAAACGGDFGIITERIPEPSMDGNDEDTRELDAACKGIGACIARSEVSSFRKGVSVWGSNGVTFDGAVGVPTASDCS